MNVALSALLIFGAWVSPGDTLVEVREGDRVLLEEFGGLVSVRTWDRAMLLARTESKESTGFRIRRSGSTIRLELPGGRVPDDSEEFTLTMPSWMGLAVSGTEVEVQVRGLDGEVNIRSLEGDLYLRDLGGAVDVYTAEGEIEAVGLTGSARLRSGDDDLWVFESSAALDLESVEGDILLEGIDARRVSVRTTDGEIEYSGSILERGDYGFFSHRGDIQLHLAPSVNLEANILSYEGEFRSEFPVHAAGFRSGESLGFTLGSGGARLVVETFDGDISLLRGPEVRIQAPVGDYNTESGER